VLDFDPLERVATLEIRDPRAVVVGTLLTEGLDEPLVVRELDLHASPRGLRMQAWTGAGRYGLADSQAYAVHHRYADAHLWGSWRYRVERANGARIDARPVLAAHGLPSLVAVELSPGIPGADLEAVAGLEILVEFVEGDRSLPRVVAFAGRDQSTWSPARLTLDATAIELGAAATLGVARDTDTVEVTIPAGSVIVAVAGGTLNPTPIVLTGEITGASSKVKAE
jgi:hypothetical protein